MDKSSRRAILYNMSSQALMQAVIFIAGLLVPRFILLYYGSEINGIATTVSQIINYASLLEAGLGLASIQALYKPLAEKNQEGINGICAATRSYYFRLTGWFSAVIAAAAVVYALLAQGSTDKVTIALIVIAISSSTIIENAFHAKYNVLLTADQKLYAVGYAKIVGLVLQAAVKLALIFSGAHIVVVYAAGSLALVSRIPFLALYIKKKYPKVSFKGKMDLTALKQRSALMIHQLAGMIVNNSGAIIISITSKEGLKLASVYAVYRLVYKNMYALITGAFSNGSVASFGHLLAGDKLEEARRSYRQYEVIYYAVIGVLYGAIASLILPFVGLYTDGVTDAQYILPMLALLMTVDEVLNSTRVPVGMLINAAGHFHQTKYRALAEAIINFVVTLLLIGKYDIYAIVIAGIVSYCYRVTDMILYSNKHILQESAWKSLKPILIAWLGVALTWGVMQLVLQPVTGWLGFFGWGIVTVLISCVIVLTLALVLCPKITVAFVKNFLVRFRKK